MRLKFFVPFIFLSPFSLYSKVFEQYGPEDYRKPRNTAVHFAIESGSLYKLKLIASGSGAIAGNYPLHKKTPTWGFLFNSEQTISLEEAQKMSRELLSNILEKMEKSEDIKQYYAREPELPIMKLPPLSNKSFGIRIDFWDKNVDRPLYPYIAEIRICEGKIYYHYADPKTQGLQDPCLTETL